MKKNLVLTLLLSSILTSTASANPPRRPVTTTERPTTERMMIEERPTGSSGGPIETGALTPSSRTPLQERLTAQGESPRSVLGEASRVVPVVELSARGETPSRSGTDTPNVSSDLLAPPQSAPSASHRTTRVTPRRQMPVPVSISSYTPANYNALSASQKIDILMDYITRDAYPSNELPSHAGGVTDMLKLFMSGFLQKVFTNASDEMLMGRKKLIHANGATAEIEFKTVENSPYTGIYKTGAIGVARISIATLDLGKFAPGIGIKFLVDGRQSENIIAMYSLNGQGTDRNVFRNPFSNIINPPVEPNFGERQLVAAFHRTILRMRGLFRGGDAPASEFNLPQHEVAMVESNGNPISEEDAISPYQIILEPTAEATQGVQAEIDANPAQDFRTSMVEGVQPGTVLYRVMARRYAGATPEFIGEITTTSRFITSLYQDTQLNIRHGRINSPEFR